MDKIKAYLIAIILVIGGAFVLVMGIKDLNGMKNPEDLNALKAEDIEKGMYVQGVTNFVLDYYCYEEETTLGVIKNETNRWYLIPFGENLDCYIGVKVSGDAAFKKYETVCDDTWAYLEGTAASPQYNLDVRGKVAMCSGEIKENLESYVAQFSAAIGEDCSDMFVDYYIDLTTTNGNVATIVFGAVMIVGGIGFLLFTLMRAKKEEEAREMALRMQASAQASQNIYGGMATTTTDAQGFYTAAGGDDLDRLLREEDEKAKKDMDDWK